MAKIKQITAKEILNGHGSPTIECTVILSDGAIGTASCPTGTTVGSYEALELRDKDPMRYRGLGVLHAVQNVQTIIAPKLTGMDATKQQDIDKALIELDGTQNKSHLGANATLSVSMAVCKAAAESATTPLFLYLKQFAPSTTLKMPTPLFNLMSGGKHVPDTFDFQEFFVVPASSKPWSESLPMGVSIFHTLQDVLHSNGFSTLTSSEGAFAPRMATNHDAFNLISQAIGETNNRLGFDVFLGCDASSSSFYRNGQYHIKDKSQGLSGKSINEYYLELSKQFHIIYWEDLCSEEDWDGWSDAVTKLSQEVVIAGDNLTATNPYRLQMAIDKKALTGVVIKPTQIGTVIESIAISEMAHSAGLKIIVSHRSNETSDDFIADFAVAIGADYGNFGALDRGEHIEKYNRLSQIDLHLRTLKQ